MYVIINATQQKAFVNNVSIRAFEKVYTLSDLEGKPIWNIDRRLFNSSQVTEIQREAAQGIKPFFLELEETKSDE